MTPEIIANLLGVVWVSETREEATNRDPESTWALLSFGCSLRHFSRESFSQSPPTLILSQHIGIFYRFPQMDQMQLQIRVHVLGLLRNSRQVIYWKVRFECLRFFSLPEVLRSWYNWTRGSIIIGILLHPPLPVLYYLPVLNPWISPFSNTSTWEKFRSEDSVLL